MKILDATTIIAIFNNLNRPELIKKIRLLGHELAVTSYIMNTELLDRSTRDGMKECIDSSKVRILKSNSVSEIKKFGQISTKLGIGECDVIL